jgi:hypothetical protein
MKKFSKKGVLLFAGAMAVCAFVLPGVSSAASWSPANNHSTLDSSNFGFTAQTVGALISSCNNSRLTTRVDNGDVLTITTGTFSGCTSTAPALSNTCLTTLTATNFPWRATATSTTNVVLTGIDVDLRFEHPVPPTGATCGALNGNQTRLTGSINGAYNLAARTITFTNAEGLVLHPGPTPATFRGSFSTTGALTVID